MSKLQAMPSDRIQVLVSTMNQTTETIQELITQMGLTRMPAVIVCQNSPELSVQDLSYKNIKFIIDDQIGLSRSRNLAIAAATREFCIIADDDMRYSTEQLENIVKAFDSQPNADILISNVQLSDGQYYRRKHPAGKVSIFGAFRVSSVQVAFRRVSVDSNGLAFDETFGAGTDNFMTEENIFIADAIRQGLETYSTESVVGTLKEPSSTGDQFHTEEILRAKGRGFFRISPALSIPYAIYFAMTKMHLYREKTSLFGAINSLLKGIFEQSWKLIRP